MDNQPRLIHDQGQPGQIVVLDHISPESLPGGPYNGYSQPAFFNLIERTVPGDGRNNKVLYTLRDSNGKTLTVEGSGGGPGGYLIPVEGWVAWKAATSAMRSITQDAKVHDLQVQVGILREILISQGIRVVSDTQAEKLGIKP